MAQDDRSGEFTAVLVSGERPDCLHTWHPSPSPRRYADIRDLGHLHYVLHAFGTAALLLQGLHRQKLRSR
jgi:hypothetical protein